jgi:anti-sigma factor RsiW
MNCQEIRERLPALIDKELEPAEQAEVEKHLAECLECQKEKSRQEKFTTSVKVSLEGLKPSDRFVKQVIAKLPEGDAEAQAAEAASARKKTTVSLIVALIIIVLAVAITAILAARRKAEEEKRGLPGVPAPVQPEGRK